MKNERTSDEVAVIAGRLLQILGKCEGTSKVSAKQQYDILAHQICTVDELQAVCASALTQTADKPVVDKPILMRVKPRRKASR